MSNYLILGSEGVVGKALCNYLDEINISYTRFDKLISNDQDLTNLENSSYLEECIKKTDLVFFLAFDVGGSKYLTNDNFEMFDNNIVMIFNTYKIIKKYNKKSIFATSIMSNMTYNNYGLSKLIGERYSELLGGLCFKIWNCYGFEDPNIYGEKMHAIGDFICKAIKGKDIDMLTDGEEIRQYTYTKDFAKALYQVGVNYDEILAKQNLIDISCFEWTKLIDIANLIKEIVFEKTGIDVKVIPSDKKATLQKIVNYPEKDILKYWKPETKLKDGLSEIVDNYLKVNF